MINITQYFMIEIMMSISKRITQEFDKHLKQRVKGDKISRRVSQVGLPASIGVVGATVKGGQPMKKSCFRCRSWCWSCWGCWLWSWKGC